MRLSASNLSDSLILESQERLRLFDSVVFVAAQLLNQGSWQAELASFGAAPAEHLTLLGQGDGVQSSTCYLLDLVVFEKVDLGRRVSVLAVVLASLASGTPTV